MTKTLLPAALLQPLTLFSQLSDGFSDGNFTASPAHTAAWVIHASRQLQSAHTTAGSTFYRSTPGGAGQRHRMGVLPAPGVYYFVAQLVDVFLTATQSDLAHGDNR